MLYFVCSPDVLSSSSGPLDAVWSRVFKESFSFSNKQYTAKLPHMRYLNCNLMVVEKMMFGMTMLTFNFKVIVLFSDPETDSPGL